MKSQFVLTGESFRGMNISRYYICSESFPPFHYFCSDVPIHSAQLSILFPPPLPGISIFTKFSKKLCRIIVKAAAHSRSLRAAGHDDEIPTGEHFLLFSSFHEDFMCVLPRRNSTYTRQKFDLYKAEIELGGWKDGER